MTTSASGSNPTENPILTKLKGKWEASDFAIDRDGVYGIDEALESAGKQLIDGMPGRGTGLVGPDPTPEDAFGQQVVEGLVDYIDSKFISKNPLPHRKTCHFCDRTSRDEHCSTCYWLIRSSATYIANPQNPPIKHDFHPCYICAEGSILAAICNECEKILLE